MSRQLTLVAAALLALVTPMHALPERDAATWEAPPGAKDVQNPVKTDGRTVERGARLYKQYCVPCHGVSGVGDGAMAKKLGYKPADLTLERLNRQTDGEIFWKISKGKEPMPDFEKTLSGRERWDIVSYVRTLLRVIQ